MDKSNKETIHVKFEIANEVFDTGFLGKCFAAIKLTEGLYALVDIPTQRIELRFTYAEEMSEGYILHTENGLRYVQTNRGGDILQISDYFKSLIIELFEGLLVETFQETIDFIPFSAEDDQEELPFGGWIALTKDQENGVNCNSVTCDLTDRHGVVVIRNDYICSEIFQTEVNMYSPSVNAIFRIMKDEDGFYILRIADMKTYGPVELYYLVADSTYVSKEYLVIHEGSKQMLLRISDFTVSTSGSSIKPILSENHDHPFNYFILKIGEQEVLMRGSDFTTSRLADSITVFEGDGVAVLKTDGKVLAVVRLSDFKTIAF